ncbi:nuclear transport factor 2 family protein [Halopseudomonas sp.]|uniref:nuclear transport factor 2 family protein n=1 Tax=Halopseudomonas sp. TaxID=2901191 RepID=UPI0030012D7E|tara:strand:- start:13175 stop:13450 length:276 start_codon:yes stop_codon:yes gene_type:complete
MSKVVEQWHEIVRNQDAAGLDSLLAEDVVFHSPVVHTPQVGKKITRLYLMAAMKVLNEPGHFVYLREVVQANMPCWNSRPKSTVSPSTAWT